MALQSSSETKTALARLPEINIGLCDSAALVQTGLVRIDKSLDFCLAFPMLGNRFF